jgi:hypothetical protein
MRRAGPLVVFFMLAPCVRANAGVLAGVITDATAQPLRAVSVVAEPLASSTSSLTTESDADGRYALSLPAGTHQVSFRLAGYALHVTRVTVDESGPLARDVTLQLALASSVVVQARATFRNLAEVGSAFDLVGVASAASVGVVAASQLEERSLLRPADVFERVPGLVVSQHSGEGKGNQYYVRGFNIDHGTDLSLQVAGVPVNLPTHAHGQGYADANFLIPELVAGIQFQKGTYHADAGDFSRPRVRYASATSECWTSRC